MTLAAAAALTLAIAAAAFLIGYRRAAAMRGVERLHSLPVYHGAYAALEGDGAAVAAGERLARAVGMTPVTVTAAAKPAYHAAAAMASNYVVALADTARRIAEAGGVPAAMARDMYLPLMRGTVENVFERGAASALTGAIRRGDAGTVGAHLAALSGADRELYVRLGIEALRLAVEAGLGPEAAQRVEAVLRAPGA